ncbi:MAG: FAD-binding oxidoreductase [Microbacterium sp.]|uniref:FAD-binding oxidoreductase n=1 Tax=Microbacterium sp. TaxID=51671 RepID=UPI002605D566|nr:FAD-binding oxidoreductase [Microbacterium sp.]MCX6501465.1 FAD-binding oxidoreductase [Microbacterium sp.]
MTDAQTTLGLPAIPDELVAALIDVVGRDGVHVDRARIDEFKDAYWIPGDETYAASAVVQPTTVEQVQDIVRLANRFEVPLWPHSQGRNLGHGGPSPRVRGAIQLGFQRMNRVLEIDDELAYAVVEPGVTWQDLHDAAREAGYALLTPCPDLGWGSIIGNSMDSGHTYQHYGADYLMPTGFEVVLPDGELLRTGQGALPGSTSWHTYKRSLGPALDPLFIQSNLGIVTKMGVWLKRLPEAYAPVTLVVEEDADLEAAVDAIRELRLAGVLEGVPAMYSTLRAAHMIRDAPVPPRPEPFTASELQEIGARAGVGAWAVRTSVWGDRELIAYKLRRISAVWEAIPSGRVEAADVYSSDEYDALTGSAAQIGIGIPTLKALESTPPHIAHLDISPVVPLRGNEIRRVVEQLRRNYAEAGMNFGAGIMVVGERSAVVIAGIRYDKTDESSARGAFALGRRMILELGELGYGDSRPHIEFMDLAAEQYSYNDHAYRRFVERIKDAVDPQGILAPGRHGIWPSAYRRGLKARPPV